jgi:hypothetical protein
MGWETIIPNNTINMRSTIMLIEDTKKSRTLGLRHTRTRTGAPLPLTTSERPGEEGEQRIASVVFWILGVFFDLAISGKRRMRCERE